MQPALLWKRQDDNAVLCQLCSHFCHIEPDERGKCGVRVNKGGDLFTLVADRVAAANLDPIEKKPLYHFYPGTTSFSVGTMGCNLACSFCQNYSLSFPPKQGQEVRGERFAPEQIVEAAKRYGAHSIAYTYSEPTIFFELVLPTAKLAHERGLKNVLVSNGFMSPQCLDELGPHIDAANIDLKGFTDDFYQQYCGAKLTPVKNNLKRIAKSDWWLEVTTLVIPGANDNPAELTRLAEFIAGNLGLEVPWHISRFHPTYKLMDRDSTPTKTLEMAYDIGKKAGLYYVYVGNVPGHPGNNTYCPGCNAVAIRREGFQVVKADLSKCSECGRPVHGVAMNALEDRYAG